MDSLFGIGPAELVVVFLIAVLVLGPKQIRELARFFKQFVAEVRPIFDQFVNQLNEELDAEGDVRGILTEIQDVQREVAGIGRDLRKAPHLLTQEVMRPRPNLTADTPARPEADTNTIAPPQTAIPKPLPVEDDLE